ncbi:DUF2163 domain-containing protein [Rhodobacteraceae bacterium 2CG4]|uniref:DUF2163 domain-containing protein n=1 Tax=Halovulum marinum TaxID=2662447 RepID=A0A6L5YYM6_9RHOB|nr:DUF2163 domain-containing protein [Halovulum marinum]MSU89010.1 DUF2163 domain-containing protein [Halovulum marinum]
MAGAETLKARLAEGATRLARCWEICRKDGTRLGFTDHDCALEFDGLVFEANAGLDAGTLERSIGLSVDNVQAVGALRSDRVSEADILAGRYDGAEVRQWLVDWSDPDARLELFRGSLGEIRTGSGRFEAELRGLSEALNHPVGRAYLKTCDRELGDAKCGVDLDDPRFSTLGAVAEVGDRRALTFYPGAEFDPGWFEGGALTWTDGANAGLDGLVRADRASGAGRELTLWAEAKAGIRPGDRFRVVAGCDKHIRTCRAKFANALNFRGFPYMPGDDWVTAYPRQGATGGETARYWAEARDE